MQSIEEDQFHFRDSFMNEELEGKRIEKINEYERLIKFDP
jgi:hypothetical protein